MKMKRIILIVALPALVAGGCRQKSRGAVAQATNSEWIAEVPSDVAQSDSAAVERLMRDYASPIRPGEALQYGHTYLDEFEFVGYNDDFDYWFFVVRKPGVREEIYLYDGLEGNAPHSKWLRGDRLHIAWRIGLAHEAGEGDTPYLTEWASRVEKIADGPVTRFRAAHPDSLRYVLPNGWDPTEEEAREARETYTDPSYYGAVEYYVAASRKPEIEALADPSAAICYTVAERKRDGDAYSVFTLWNEANTPEGELPEPLAIFWLSEGPATIWEHDPATDELIPFETD